MLCRYGIYNPKLTDLSYDLIALYSICPEVFLNLDEKFGIK